MSNWTVENNDHKAACGVVEVDPDRILLRFTDDVEITLQELMESGVPLDEDTEEELELEVVLLLSEPHGGAIDE